MENLKKHPFTTFLGIVLSLLGIALLIARYFFPESVEVDILTPWFMLGAGLLYIRAKDDVIDILTLGLKSLIQKFVK